MYWLIGVPYFSGLNMSSRRSSSWTMPISRLKLSITGKMLRWAVAIMCTTSPSVKWGLTRMKSVSISSSSLRKTQTDSSLSVVSSSPLSRRCLV